MLSEEGAVRRPEATSLSISSSNHPTFDALCAWTPPCSSVTHRRTTSRCLGSGFSCYSIPMLPTERRICRCGWLSPPTISPLRPLRQPARNTITGRKPKITLARVLPCRILLREDSRGVSLYVSPFFELWHRIIPSLLATMTANPYTVT